MPRYVFHNPNRTSVQLPAPLQGAVPPIKNLLVVTEAVNVDTPGMKAILKAGLLKILSVEEDPSTSNKIEVPVIDLQGTGGGSLVYRGAWSSVTSYSANDVVKYGAITWIALQASTGVTPEEGLFWTSIGSSDGRRTGIDLLPTADPRVFTVPETFGEASVEVFHSTGRRLSRAATPDPRAGDFVTLESGGVGSGYDTIVVLTFTPLGLVANYTLV